MPMFGLLMFLALGIDPAIAARLKKRAFFSYEVNASLTSEDTSNRRFICNPEEIFYQVMLFNAHTAGDTNFVMSFPAAPSRDWKQEIIQGFRRLSAPANVLRAIEGSRMYSIRERDRSTSVVIPLDAEGLADYLFAVPSKDIASLQLNGKACTRAGPMLRDFVESPVSLSKILSDAGLEARHHSQSGLFSKGIYKGHDGRPNLGAKELVEWMEAACGGINSEASFVDMILAASLIIVRNQVFGDRNHRSAMRIIVEALPDDVKKAFTNDVISYSASDGTFRGKLYRAMHGGEQYIPFAHLAPFSSGAWSSEIRQYRAVLDEWLTERGHPLPQSETPARVAQAPQTPCNTDKECLAIGLPCRRQSTGEAVKYKWCDKDCFCME